MYLLLKRAETLALPHGVMSADFMRFPTGRLTKSKFNVLVGTAASAGVTENVSGCF